MEKKRNGSGTNGFIHPTALPQDRKQRRRPQFADNDRQQKNKAMEGKQKKEMILLFLLLPMDEYSPMDEVPTDLPEV